MKTIRTRTLFALVLVAGFVVLAVSLPALASESASSSRGCTPAILRGGYGAGSTGLFLNPDTFAPFAEAAYFVFDGRGNLSGSSTVNGAGFVFPVTFTGTYTVNPNCTGSYTIDAGASGILHRDLVIVDNGKEVEFVGTDADVVIGGYMKKQFISGE